MRANALLVASRWDSVEGDARQVSERVVTRAASDESDSKSASRWGDRKARVQVVVTAQPVAVTRAGPPRSERTYRE